MSGRWAVWLLRAVRVAWFRRARSLLWTWVLAWSLVLCIATPSRADDYRPREVRVCVRPPGESLDRWVFSPGGGKVLTERWALQVYGPRKITVYVFDPSAPAISATYFPPRLFANLKCPPTVAPQKPEPKAARTKSEAGPRKKKKEAEEPAAKERKAEEPAAKERETKRALPRKEGEEAAHERERREKQAQEEERHRLRARERPKVLPRHGVTAAWHSKVLPEQKREGVTAAWSSKMLPAARVLPRAGAPRCGAPAPKLAGGRDGAATMAVREPILKELLGYRKAKSEAEKEAHRRKLRELFESLGASAAQPFQIMLSTQNALAVTFRDVLRGDPFRNELLGILEKKYAPIPAQCTPAAPSPDPPSGVTLPVVTLTDEGSWGELHALVQQRITAIREGCESIVRYNLQDAKNQLLKLVPALSVSHPKGACRGPPSAVARGRMRRFSMAKTRAGKTATHRRRRRWTSKEARKVLEAQVESGLTISAFAAREGLSAHRLFRWRRQLGASAPKPPTFEEVLPSKAVALVGEAAEEASNRFEVVLCSGVIVRVGESFTAEALRRLLFVVDGGRLC